MTTPMPQLLSLQDFSYEVPPELVAQQALAKRDAARLLVYSQDRALVHASVSQLPQILAPKTVLVVNDTKVFAARIFGKLADGASIEVFLLEKPTEENDGFCAPCLLRPGRKVQEGSLIHFSEGRHASVSYKPQKGDPSPFRIRFSESRNFSSWLEANAFVPLPMYIKRERLLPWRNSADTERYQTVYAAHEGSVAAPTAGLHFTPQQLSALAAQEIQIAPVTLHVGAGTFLPVKTVDPSQHKMHKEKYCVPAATWTTLQSAKAQGHKVVAVGTTSFRCIESFLKMENQDASWHETDLFIHPKSPDDIYRSELFDGIMTNFHQPCSTLFMLMSALLGLHETQAVYRAAIEQRYRLFSFGDSGLFWF